MEAKEKIKQNKENIWQAIDDYKAHSCQTSMLNDVTDTFVTNLAEDNYYAKDKLRTLFRKSPVWNEKLDAIVINGTRTHNPNYDRVYELAESILAPARMAADSETNAKIIHAIRFFTRPNAKAAERKEAIEAIESLAPNAYAPRKKHSRIFKALCDALHVSDNTAGSFFQRQYAKFADEIASRKIPFKLYVSVNPAHFLTMSNPKEDERGDMMTSCHSFNSVDDRYNCGCTGYARDNYTFIVFTAADPNEPETLNNRKTSRQIFAYKPDNGILLQSRLYNTSGGTCGAQEDSKLYRDLIQRELSDLEGAVNYWKTVDYYGNHICTIDAGLGYGGYKDWTYKEFAAKISIRSDHAGNYWPFEVGTSGLCICCGDEIRRGLYCDSCSGEISDDDDDDDDDDETCDNCARSCDTVYAVRNSSGRLSFVCSYCRDENYTLCEVCDVYYPNDQTTETEDGRHVCHRCLEESAERDAA